MSVFDPQLYKKAHKHGPGRVIVIPKGVGYSVLTPPPGVDAKGSFVPGREGSLFVPPDWYHQHFNTGTGEARYLALGPLPQFSGNPYRHQIEYPFEDAWIRGRFESEIAKHSLKTLMPQEAYEGPHVRVGLRRRQLARSAAPRIAREHLERKTIDGFNNSVRQTSRAARHKVATPGPASLTTMDGVQGLPVYRGHFVAEPKSVELAPWPERGVNAAFIQLTGMQGVCEARITEIPPGQTFRALQDGRERDRLRLDGQGLATVWAGDGPKKTFEWQKSSLFILPRNCWYPAGERPRRPASACLNNNHFPLALSSFPDLDFYFKGPAGGAGAALQYRRRRLLRRGKDDHA